MSGKTDQIKRRIKEAAGALAILTAGRTTKRRLLGRYCRSARGCGGGGVHGSSGSRSDGDDGARRALPG